MNKIITAINQKGGVGKTTTALALAAGLNKKGHRVLAIDLDAQGNFSFSLGAKPNTPTAFELLTGEATAMQAIQRVKDCDLIPAKNMLATVDRLLAPTTLRNAIENVVDFYDFAIIDTPPSLGLLTINALAAANSVIIPAQADIFSVKGIEQLADTIQQVKALCNGSLYIDGVLLTRYNARSVLSRDVTKRLNAIAERIGTKVFTTKIREAVAIKEAQILQESLFDYAPGSVVAWDYRDFLDEYLTTQGQ